VLAINALAKDAKIVKIANCTCPRKMESTATIEPIKSIEASGMPRRIAIIDASVCSLHVIGNQ
jgi:hypothetical protein